VSAASRYLGLPHTTLKHKIQRHGIRELALTARSGAPPRPRVE
jgi:hypothetical protein